MSLKPLTLTSPAAEADPKETLSRAAQGKGAAYKPKKQLEFKTLDEDVEIRHRILAFSHSGGGKTRALIAWLRMGYRIFDLDTDVGGDSLNTVRNELADRPDLLRNLLYVHLDDYDDIDGFLTTPEKYSDRYNTFEPDLHAWDGFSGFQLGPMEAEVAGNSKISELQFDIPTWGQIRRGTLQQWQRFMNLRTPSGRLVHKYMTCLESKPRENKTTGQDNRREPLISGSAESIIEAGFDMIIRMKKDEFGKFTYGCSGAKGAAGKSRSYKDVNAEEPADMEALWRKMNPGLVLPLVRGVV